MFFVIDKPKLQRIVALIRDDRTPEAQAHGGHYLRLEASQGQPNVDPLFRGPQAYVPPLLTHPFIRRVERAQRRRA